jgi:transcriptional regulator with XRE-family HTH domain
MTPSEQCKAAGLKSLADLAKISGVSVQTLINWHKDKPALFSTVLAGAVVIKAANGEN